MFTINEGFTTRCSHRGDLLEDGSETFSLSLMFLDDNARLLVGAGSYDDDYAQDLNVLHN